MSDDKKRIALCVIAGADMHEQGIYRMLESVEGKVDGVFVSYNGGTTNDPRAKRLMHELEALKFKNWTISEFDWCDDFAAARNHSFSLVDRECFDWIIWLDCDDILPANFDPQEIIREAEERHAHGIFLRYDYVVDEKTHRPLASHYKERMFRADVNWIWRYPIHENCQGPTGTRIAKIDGPSIVHLREKADDKRHRNRAIISRWYNEDREDRRATMFMAHELFAEAEALDPGTAQNEIAQAALKLYNKVLAHEDFDEDSYACNLQVFQLLKMMRRFNDALNIGLQSIKMQPAWPAAYCAIAELSLQIEEYDSAIAWARACRAACSVPESLHVFEHFDVDYKPFVIEGHALLAQEKFSHALGCYQAVHGIFASKFTQDLINKANRAGSEAMVDKFEEVDYRKNNWGKQPEKSIAFFTRPHFEEWDAGTMESQGLGGTESSVIRLAQGFATKGWRVVIFGTPPVEGVDHRGIEWYRSQSWHPDEPFTVTVAVRAPEIFDGTVNSDVKILWLHDVNMGDVRITDDGVDRFAQPDVIVCPSLWHVGHICHVYDFGDLAPTLMTSIPNGFDRDLFVNSGTEMRNLDKYVYASSPDRGLQRLLEFWPDIRKLRPEAELHVFYGWESIDKIIEYGLPTAPALRWFKMRIEKMLDELGREEAGIIWHGRVDQATLAAHFQSASLMLYPADFQETFGIVFVQAMAAGCPPLVPDLGNLPMLLEGPHQFVVGGASPDSMIYHKLFMERFARIDGMLRDFINNDALRHDIKHMIDSTKQFDWPGVIYQWESLISEMRNR